MMKKSFLLVVLFSLAVALASPLDVQARNPTPSKRYALPILPRQPGPSITPSKRSLDNRAPSPLYIAREASPLQRLAARQAAPSKRLSARQLAASPRYVNARAPAPAPSKRVAEESAAPQKRSLDEQRVMEGTADSLRGFCLNGLVACPVLSTPGQFPRTFTEWEAVGFECVDFTADLRSCGGCSSLDPTEHDCTKIPHVQGVACVAGECQISSCQPGYSLQAAGGYGCSPTE
ncbi:hypothetical protein DEU56DRAFT_847723 [Suillus clintonianus]|uniref:uncharacterized protein n=1 Tax=Suillus clintonianus TaxID=1904413 RepID=UPI001B8772FA|nr:uncharacterized protein DEU56DRAFT_847723 [Suillus clintonianus]KAG2154566.1 hypothetical protein DEU56DRAFT_847723 [Suillus clintonianus]